MTNKEAIFVRRSCRRFLSRPISPAQQAQLCKAIGDCNARSGLTLRLVCGHAAPFAPFSGPGGHLTGAENYLVLAGPASDSDLDEKCGYFGEELVLTAASMGLASCWIAGSYLPEAVEGIDDSQRLVCVAAIGHPAEQPDGPRPSKTAAELSSAPADAPAWFARGMEAVCLAPSGMNRQGVHFAPEEDGTVTARRTDDGPFSLVDLGIAKHHFELGAHGGTWTWGDGGCFRKAAEEKSCGAVIWRERDGVGEYLLARHNGGHWSFPKGHVESGETEADTALREIREETGLLARLDTGFRYVSTYYPKPNVIKDVVFFLATVTGGTEHAQEEEIAQLCWLPFAETRQRLTFAADEELLLAAKAYLEKQG